MNLFHWSPEPLGPIRSRAQLDMLDMLEWLKPIGLWVSVDDEWEQWCKGENFRLDQMKYLYRIHLADDARVLRVSAPEGIDAVTQQYGKSIVPEARFLIRMDWISMAEQYQGIIVSPYVKRWHVIDPVWYLAWDCASGCIWDAAAIKGYEQIA